MSVMSSFDSRNPKQPSSPRKPVIGITMGDPAGIGPEVVVKALADHHLREQARFILFGMNELLAYAADLGEIEPYWWRIPHDSSRMDFPLVYDMMVLDYDEFSMLGSIVHQPTKQGGAGVITLPRRCRGSGVTTARRSPAT